MRKIFTKIKSYQQMKQQNNTLKLLLEEQIGEKNKTIDFMGEELTKASKRIRTVETENKDLKDENKKLKAEIKKLKQELKEK